MRGASALALTLLAALAVVGPAAAADYTGPLIDAHSHLPNATAIDAYVAAMKRHNVRKVVLLGVGGVQPDEVEWIEAAVKKYPDLVSAAVRGPDPPNIHAPPSLAKEKGPLHPGWKALIAKLPDPFLMGVDGLAARLFEPAMLDRLMTWTRRVLGELPPDVAERVAWKNASVLYHLD